MYHWTLYYQFLKQDIESAWITCNVSVMQKYEKYFLNPFISSASKAHHECEQENFLCNRTFTVSF